MELNSEDWEIITKTAEYTAKQPPTPFLAEYIFCKVFERPQAGECKKRADKTEEIYSQMTKTDN